MNTPLTTTPLSDRFHPIANLFPLLENEQFDYLVADIRANGLRQPIVEYEGLILDGRNRYRACLEAGVPISAEKYDGDDPVGCVISANLRRRHLNESQRAMVMARIATLGRGGDRSNPPRGVLQADAARALHIGVRTGQRAKVVLQHGVPELVRRVEQGGISVKVAAQVASLSPDAQIELVGQPEAKLRGAVKIVVRAQRERQLAARTAAAAQALGSSLYSVVYADPPWRFEPYSRVSGMDRAADNHYPTLDADALAALEMPAADDCVLFCWSTIAMLPAAMAFLGHHGFVYRTAYGWLKPGPGTGYWSQTDQLELLLVGVRGEVPAPAPGTQPPQVLMIPRGKHSAKPDEFAAMIERMFPNVPKLEMFARRPRAGWDVWGNEVEANVAT